MPNTRIGLKISTRDRELIEKVCSARGEGISSFVRKSIRRELVRLGYLGEDVQKALGV